MTNAFHMIAAALIAFVLFMIVSVPLIYWQLTKKERTANAVGSLASEDFGLPWRRPIDMVAAALAALLVVSGLFAVYRSDFFRGDSLLAWPRMPPAFTTASIPKGDQPPNQATVHTSAVKPGTLAVAAGATDNVASMLGLVSIIAGRVEAEARLQGKSVSSAEQRKIIDLSQEIFAAAQMSADCSTLRPQTCALERHESGVTKSLCSRSGNVCRSVHRVLETAHGAPSKQVEKAAVLEIEKTVKSAVLESK